MSIAKILAGDVGGSKTLLGLFDPVPARPAPILVREFRTSDFPDLMALLSAFSAAPDVRGTSVDAACFGVAGPVIGSTARLTNVDFAIDGASIGRQFDIPRVSLLNDLQAMAHAIPLLRGGELHALQEGIPLRGGNMALIAAGTGLGEALLHNVDGRFVPSPSEGGHADWSPRNEREIAILRELVSRFGRAEVEHVLSGPGLVNVHRVTHRTGCSIVDERDADAPAQISRAAFERRCAGCVEAMEIFVEAYGAEAGNLALRSLSTAGLFIGGGIAPKILPALDEKGFVRAFRDKAPLDDMLSRVPVNVILNPEAGLLGAAAFAASAGG